MIDPTMSIPINSYEEENKSTLAMEKKELTKEKSDIQPEFKRVLEVLEALKLQLEELHIKVFEISIILAQLKNKQRSPRSKSHSPQSRTADNLQKDYENNNLPSNIERKELKEEKQNSDEDTFSSRRTQSCESDIQASSSHSELGANWYSSHRSYNNTCMRVPESIPFRTPRPTYKMPESMLMYRVPESMSMYRVPESMSMYRMPRPFLVPCLSGSQGPPCLPGPPGQYHVRFLPKKNCRCSHCSLRPFQ